MASLCSPPFAVGIGHRPRGFGCFKQHKGSCNNAFTLNRRNLMNDFLRATCFVLNEDSEFTTVSMSAEVDLLQRHCATMGQDDILAENFSVYDDEPDLDYPTDGFSSIPEAIEDIRQGKFVIVIDDENRQNEGDLAMAASLATPEAMAFLVKHGTGIVCVSMKEEDLERLDLPLMVPNKENEERLLRKAFTVSVDAKEGTTTGVSAKDRAKTVKMLASLDSNADDFNRPGHIYPLKYREGGVLKRAGHTEASIDLAALAGLAPVGVLCEIVNEDDGSMARLPKLHEFAKKENLKLISVADLVRYRRKRVKLVKRVSDARLHLKWASVQAYCYQSVIDGLEHIAMVKGEIGDGLDILVRIHSECLTGDLFGSAICDCSGQLEMAMKMIERAGRGVLVYLRGHEGRAIGLGHKLRAHNSQDIQHDAMEVNEELLGFPLDSQEYGVIAQILQDLGVQSVKLMTKNPGKYAGLKGYGLSITAHQQGSFANSGDDREQKFL